MFKTALNASEMLFLIKIKNSNKKFTSALMKVKTLKEI